MKPTEWLAVLFLLFVFLTSSKANAVDDNGVAHRVAMLEEAVMTLTSELEAANTEITNLKNELTEVQSNSVLGLDGILTYDTDENGYPRALFTGVNVQIVDGLGPIENPYLYMLDAVPKEENKLGESIESSNPPFRPEIGPGEKYNLVDKDAFPDDIYAAARAAARAKSQMFVTIQEALLAVPQTNGVGNLIVGYNEKGYTRTDKSGSHNIVVGTGNSYPTYGGLVAGRDNTISGAYATVTAGSRNTASGDYSSVSGGGYNYARGGNSSVSGGGAPDDDWGNYADGPFSSISGGFLNWAPGQQSSVSGGAENYATGSYSSISGGQYNRASGFLASVSGGGANTASGNWSSISGGGGYYGGGNIASGEFSSVSGGGGGFNSEYGNIASGFLSSISGGGPGFDSETANIASGDYSSVLGGSGQEATAEYETIPAIP